MEVRRHVRWVRPAPLLLEAVERWGTIVAGAGTVMLALASFSVAGKAVGRERRNWNYYLQMGFLCFSVLTGSLGVLAGRRKTSLLARLYLLVLLVFSAVFVGGSAVAAMRLERTWEHTNHFPYQVSLTSAVLQGLVDDATSADRGGKRLTESHRRKSDSDDKDDKDDGDDLPYLSRTDIEDGLLVAAYLLTVLIAAVCTCYLHCACKLLTSARRYECAAQHRFVPL